MAVIVRISTFTNTLSFRSMKNQPDEFFQSNVFYFPVHPSEAKLDDSNGPIGRPRPDWPTMDNKMLGD